MVQVHMVQNVKAVIGEGSLAKIVDILADSGKKKPLFVCDAGIVKAGILDMATEALKANNVEFAVYDKCLPDPPAYTVQEGFEFFQANGCDTVIAVGGGSAMDTAKGINILRFNEGPIIRYSDMSVPMNPAPGLIAIPTTSGTGSELSDGLVLSEGTTKIAVVAPLAMSEYAILDPRIMVGLPAHITASTGMDVLAHAAEAYVSNISNSFTDMVSEKLIEVVYDYLPIATHDPKNMVAREKMCVAACLAGWMLGQAHSIAGHSIAHAIGGHYHIPHGFACAYALPPVLEYCVDCCPEKIKKIGEIFKVQFTGNETNAQIGEMTKKAIADFRDNKLGLKAAKDWDHTASPFADVADTALKDVFQLFNPRKMTKDECIAILEEIFA